jgi:hypothetical protein
LAGETEVLRENLPQCCFVSTTDPTCCLDANLGHCSGKPATNCLSCGTAFPLPRVSSLSPSLYVRDEVSCPYQTTVNYIFHVIKIKKCSSSNFRFWWSCWVMGNVSCGGKGVHFAVLSYLLHCINVISETCLLSPSRVAQMVMHLTCVQVVHGSDLGQDID